MPDISEVGGGDACRLAPEGRPFPAYNEEAFHYFLALERTRLERSNRPLMLVLANARRRAPDPGRRHDQMTAQKLFSGLWRCTREADIIGWYRDGRVAGAVLTQDSPGSPADVAQQVRARVTATLRAELPPTQWQKLCVHVVRLEPNAVTLAHNTR